MDRSVPFTGPDPDSDVTEVTSPRHKRIVYAIYGIGMVLSIILFFTIADMTSWANRILFIMSIVLMSINAWLSAEYIDDLETEYRMFREIERNASDMIPYIITIAVLTVTLSRKDHYAHYFKYSVLVAIISLIAVVIVVWLPENNKWLIRYMRDAKTVLFTIGALFGISSVYSIIANLATTPSNRQDNSKPNTEQLPTIPSNSKAAVTDDISPTVAIEGAV